MTDKDINVQDVYDKQGNLLGIFLSREVWEMVGERIRPILEEVMQDNTASRQERDIPEPMDDWKMLKKSWDFKYDLTNYVYCENCGNETNDWEQDDPRRFKLSAANLGGLVAFTCTNCRAKIIKQHFKDHIKVDTKPPK